MTLKAGLPHLHLQRSTFSGSHLIMVLCDPEQRTQLCLRGS